jgi:hypothetical protein
MCLLLASKFSLFTPIPFYCCKLERYKRTACNCKSNHPVCSAPSPVCSHRLIPLKKASLVHSAQLPRPQAPALNLANKPATWTTCTGPVLSLSNFTRPEASAPPRSRQSGTRTRFCELTHHLHVSFLLQEEDEDCSARVHRATQGEFPPSQCGPTGSRPN